MLHADMTPVRDRKTIAALVAAETDSDKILELTNELIEALDEESNRLLDIATPASKKSAA